MDALDCRPGDIDLAVNFEMLLLDDMREVLLWCFWLVLSSEWLEAEPMLPSTKYNSPA